jgi:hypothetical protein
MPVAMPRPHLWVTSFETASLATLSVDRLRRPPKGGTLNSSSDIIQLCEPLETVPQQQPRPGGAEGLEFQIGIPFDESLAN